MIYKFLSSPAKSWFPTAMISHVCQCIQSQHDNLDQGYPFGIMSVVVFPCLLHSYAVDQLLVRPPLEPLSQPQDERMPCLTLVPPREAVGQCELDSLYRQSLDCQILVNYLARCTGKPTLSQEQVRLTMGCELLILPLFLKHIFLNNSH